MRRVVPFAPALVQVDRSAPALQVRRSRSRLAEDGRRPDPGHARDRRGARAARGGLSGSAPTRCASSRRSRPAAPRRPTALRQNLTTWFNFYNGYDPLFTWWMPMPFKQIDERAHGVRDVPARQGRARRTRPSAVAAGLEEVHPARRRRRSSAPCPTSTELIALPQDEMTPIVQLYSQGAGGGGRGRRPADAARRPGRLPIAVRTSPRWLDRAEVARLRQAQPQRAGRLPLHQEERRDAKSRGWTSGRSRIRRGRRTTAASRAPPAAATGSSSISRAR